MFLRDLSEFEDKPWSDQVRQIAQSALRRNLTDHVDDIRLLTSILDSPESSWDIPAINQLLEWIAKGNYFDNLVRMARIARGR